VHTPTWRIVIVNYRTGPLAARAAQHACEVVGNRGEVVVVDNASGDESPALLGRVTTARVILQDQNRGYGAALNAGARDFRGDWLLLQNADATIDAETLHCFEQRFASISRLGVVAPRLVSSDGTIQPSCRRFPTHRSILRSRGSPLSVAAGRNGQRYLLLEPATFTLCDVVAGACMAVRTETWRQLGGMDEGFFLYAEDTDFCRRAKDEGWLVGYDPSVVVAHAWGASRVTEARRVSAWHAESLAYYFRKHFPGRRWANSILAQALKLHAAWRGARR